MNYPLSTEVEFNGDKLTTIRDGGVDYVAMKPVVESIGLDWASQTVKLNNNRDKYGCCDIAIPSKGGIQNMLCLPLRKLNGWLFSINPAKVKPSVRDKLIAYQEECFAVLHDYWTKGIAVNPRRMTKMDELNQACADFNFDKGLASKHGKGLSEWKTIKPGHISKIKSLAREVNELINYVLAETGKGKITRS